MFKNAIEKFPFPSQISLGVPSRQRFPTLSPATRRAQWADSTPLSIVGLSHFDELNNLPGVLIY
jgi:hypothetical protein